MHQPPRFFTFTARRFDGTTEFALANLIVSPDNPLTRSPVGPNQARLYGASEDLGRFSYDDLVRPGNLGALVMARTMGPPGSDTDRVEVRCANSDEVPNGEVGPEDLLQQTITVTGEWSEPFLLEPRDALAVYLTASDGQTTAGIQFIVAELDTDAYLAWIKAKAVPAGASAWAQSTQNIEIDADGESAAITAADADLLTVRVTATARGTITVPAWAALRQGAQIDIIREGDTDGVVLISPAAGEKINGGAGTTRIFLPLRGALRIARDATSGEFTATSHTEVPVATNSAGATAYTYGWPGERILRLTEAAAQTVTLPAYGTANNVPTDCTLRLVNRSANTKSIAGAGAEVITGGGATANTYSLAANTSAVVFFDGTQWGVVA